MAWHRNNFTDAWDINCTVIVHDKLIITLSQEFKWCWLLVTVLSVTCQCWLKTHNRWRCGSRAEGSNCLYILACWKTILLSERVLPKIKNGPKIHHFGKCNGKIKIVSTHNLLCQKCAAVCWKTATYNTTAHTNTVVDSAAIATTTATAITIIATFGCCFTGQLAKYAGCNVTLFIHGFNLIHTTFKQAYFAM